MTTSKDPGGIGDERRRAARKPPSDHAIRIRALALELAIKGAEIVLRGSHGSLTAQQLTREAEAIERWLYDAEKTP